MTQAQAVKIYQALERLTGERLPAREAWALSKLRRALRPAWEFQGEREQAMLRELKVASIRDGTVTFETPEDALRWREAMDDLAEMETGIRIEPIHVTLAEGLTLSADDIDALEGAVIFEE